MIDRNKTKAITDESKEKLSQDIKNGKRLEMDEKNKVRIEAAERFSKGTETLGSFQKKYQKEYEKDREYIDKIWASCGPKAKERVGILIGGGSEKARKAWAGFLLDAFSCERPLVLDPKTENFFDRYGIEDAVVWKETEAADFYRSAGEENGFGTLFDPYCYGTKNFVRYNIVTTEKTCRGFLQGMYKLDELSHVSRRFQFRIDLELDFDIPVWTCENFQGEAKHMTPDVYNLLCSMQTVWTVMMKNEKIRKDLEIESFDEKIFRFFEEEKAELGIKN